MKIFAAALMDSGGEVIRQKPRKPPILSTMKLITPRWDSSSIAAQNTMTDGRVWNQSKISIQISNKIFI